MSFGSEAETEIMKASICLILELRIISKCQSSEKEPLFGFVEHPLELCLQKEFSDHQNPSAIAFNSIHRLIRCTVFMHQNQMQCVVHKNPPITRFVYSECSELLDVDYDTCPAKMLWSPCGTFGVEIRTLNLLCTWFIYVDVSLAINATFTHFNIPRTTPTCIFDMLQMKDMDLQNYTARFCGKQQPFSVIPNVSSLSIDFHYEQRLWLPEEIFGFIMFYQVIKKNEYIMTGKRFHENIYTDTSLIYYFSERQQLMKLREYTIFSLHFKTDIGLYIHVNVTVMPLVNNTVLQAYDEPSDICYKLKHFQSLATNESVTSFGTSLLFVLKTSSLYKDGVTVTFSSLSHQVSQYSSEIATNTKTDLVIALKESKFCSTRHSIHLCNIWIESHVAHRFLKLENIFVHMEMPHVLECSFGSVWIFDDESLI